VFLCISYLVKRKFLTYCSNLWINSETKRNNFHMTIGTICHQLMQFSEQLFMSRFGDGFVSSVTYGLKLPTIISSSSESVITSFYTSYFVKADIEKKEINEASLYLRAFGFGGVLCLLISISSHSLTAFLYEGKIRTSDLHFVSNCQIVSSFMLPFSTLLAIIVQRIRSIEQYFAFVLMSSSQLFSKLVALYLLHTNPFAIPISTLVSFIVGVAVTGVYLRKCYINRLVEIK
jgi:hypothetical protein